MTECVTHSFSLFYTIKMLLYFVSKSKQKKTVLNDLSGLSVWFICKMTIFEHFAIKKKQTNKHLSTRWLSTSHEEAFKNISCYFFFFWLNLLNQTDWLRLLQKRFTTDYRAMYPCKNKHENHSFCSFVISFQSIVQA